MVAAVQQKTNPFHSMSSTPITAARVAVRKDVDPYANPPAIGNLTANQFAALEKIAQNSPGYRLEVVRYGAKRANSTATHVLIWREADDSHYVGLIGRDAAQYYDHDPATEKLVQLVSRRIYRRVVCLR